MSFLSSVPCSSFTASLCFILVLCANLLTQVENKSYFGIGTRIIGDQLLLKDVLQTPPISFTEEPVIKFKYAITEPITYFEIESDKNVHANVNFSYELNLVEGTISSTNGQNSEGTIKPERFEVLLRVYGFNETMLNVNPSYILNKDQQFNGVLKPINEQKINQSLSSTEEEEFYSNYDDNEDAIDDDETADEEDIQYGDDDFNYNFDKIIEQGERQEGDFLVYEINQTSATTTELPTNHSVTFYYVDIYYITYVKFVIYEHYLYHPLDNYGNTYLVEYEQISPTTLKAIVTDHRTTSLFAQMQMYGFHPTALPVDYKPFLSNSQTLATTRPKSSLTELKLLMNAQQSTTNQHQHQQQPQQQSQNNNNGGFQKQVTELGHEILASSDNKSQVNCVQQVLSSSTNAGNDAHRMFTHWSSSILGSIVTMFAMLMMI